MFKTEIKSISNGIGFNIYDKMVERGIKKIGRDYVLSSEAKWPFLLKALSICHQNNISFGAGDTEFIHLSDGDGCCNGSSQYLRNANQFKSNYTGILKGIENEKKIKFSDITRQWHPELNVHRYLNKNSRVRLDNANDSSWISLIGYRWNGYGGPYSPEFFKGVTWENELDEDGNKIYTYRNPLNTSKES